MTYVGELGWELHVPLAATGAVFDALMAAGAGAGLRPVGYRALESLRLEKGYRAWASDITPNDTPFEAGLGWAVKLKTNTPFLGREALEATAGKPLTKRFAGFTVDDRRDRAARARDDPARRRAGRATSPRAATATRSARASATAMCAMPRA